ncbi:hypothetical protein BCY84_11529 [Trypanosoma cruzi cruzi]|uniref:Uncharacterized protein n=1 Tax=Trypanosoma cruzi TaxID=5693 RepID=A0A2V2V4F2_TRYCR|nr:hypothetical protein BCY84_11529 [Trypanosoma cruzi cruzi]PWU91425.1 hypothetical protein C4B63_43g193 [Trypanosoma cruzi]
MREMHPAIAELKRRSRAVGQRLQPLDVRPTNIVPKPPTYRRSSGPTGQHASTLRPYPSGQISQSCTASGFASTEKPDGDRGSQHTPTNFADATSTNTTTTTTTKKSSSANKVKGRESVSGSVVHRMPTKPTSVVRNPRPRNDASQGERITLREHASSLVVSKDRSRDIEGHAAAEGLMASRGLPSDGKSHLYGYVYSEWKDKSNASKSEMFTSNRDEELYFLEKYRDSREWNKMLPRSVLDVLEGEKMEDPFTTDIWTRALKEKEQDISGFYACIRCHVPLVASKYQIPFLVRGIAAFSRLNTEAVEVSVGGFSAVTSSFTKKANPLELHVRCRCCGGFLGILAPCTDIESDASSRAIFAVNSCCLEFIRGSHTQCCLDGVYGGDEDGASDGGIVTVNSLDGGEINFDDPNIFEM